LTLFIVSKTYAFTLHFVLSHFSVVCKARRRGNDTTNHFTIFSVLRGGISAWGLVLIYIPLSTRYPHTWSYTLHQSLIQDLRYQYDISGLSWATPYHDYKNASRYSHDFSKSHDHEILLHRVVLSLTDVTLKSITTGPSLLEQQHLPWSLSPVNPCWHSCHINQ
jgi:hypothetical protein